MPPKIKELEKQLTSAGFVKRAGKGSHRKYSKGGVNVTISGKAGNDAKPYQIKDVEKAINKAGTE